MLAAVTSACTSPPAATPSPSGSPARNAASVPLLPAFPAQLPEMDVAAFDELRRQLRGTPLVVNLWASWCEPCEAEAPDLAEAAERYGDRVQFLGVDVQDNRSSATAFISEHGWAYPSVFDVPGTIMTDLGIVGPPATFFYAADGTLQASIAGRITADDLDRAVRQLLA
jgi:thiol-disulfide isomerase/thioredoxin